MNHKDHKGHKEDVQIFVSFVGFVVHQVIVQDFCVHPID